MASNSSTSVRKVSEALPSTESAIFSVTIRRLWNIPKKYIGSELEIIWKVKAASSQIKNLSKSKSGLVGKRRGELSARQCIAQDGGDRAKIEIAYDAFQVVGVGKLVLQIRKKKSKKSKRRYLASAQVPLHRILKKDTSGTHMIELRWSGGSTKSEKKESGEERFKSNAELFISMTSQGSRHPGTGSDRKSKRVSGGSTSWSKSSGGGGRRARSSSMMEPRRTMNPSQIPTNYSPQKKKRPFHSNTISAAGLSTPSTWQSSNLSLSHSSGDNFSADSSAGDSYSDFEMEVSDLLHGVERAQIRDMLKKSKRLSTSLRGSMGRRSKLTKQIQRVQYHFAIRLQSLTHIPCGLMAFGPPVSSASNQEMNMIHKLEHGVVVRWERGKRKKGASQPSQFVSLEEPPHATTFWTLGEEGLHSGYLIELDASLYLDLKEQRLEDKNLKLSVYVVDKVDPSQEILLGETILNLAVFAEVGEPLVCPFTLESTYDPPPRLYIGIAPECRKFISSKERTSSPLARGQDKKQSSSLRGKRGSTRRKSRAFSNLISLWSHPDADEGGEAPSGEEGSADSGIENSMKKGPLSSMRPSNRSRSRSFHVMPQRYERRSLPSSNGGQRGQENVLANAESVSQVSNIQEDTAMTQEMEKLKKEIALAKNISKRHHHSKTSVELFTPDELQKKRDRLQKLLAQKMGVMSEDERMMLVQKQEEVKELLTMAVTKEKEKVALLRVKLDQVRERLQEEQKKNQQKQQALSKESLQNSALVEEFRASAKLEAERTAELQSRAVAAAAQSRDAALEVVERERKDRDLLLQRATLAEREVSLLEEKLKEQKENYTAEISSIRALHEAESNTWKEQKAGWEEKVKTLKEKTEAATARMEKYRVAQEEEEVQSKKWQQSCQLRTEQLASQKSAWESQKEMWQAKEDEWKKKQKDLEQMVLTHAEEQVRWQKEISVLQETLLACKQEQEKAQGDAEAWKSKSISMEEEKEKARQKHQDMLHRYQQERSEGKVEEEKKRLELQMLMEEERDTLKDEGNQLRAALEALKKGKEDQDQMLLNLEKKFAQTENLLLDAQTQNEVYQNQYTEALHSLERLQKEKDDLGDEHDRMVNRVRDIFPLFQEIQTLHQHWKGEVLDFRKDVKRGFQEGMETMEKEVMALKSAWDQSAEIERKEICSQMEDDHNRQMRELEKQFLAEREEAVQNLALKSLATVEEAKLEVVEEQKEATKALQASWEKERDVLRDELKALKARYVEEIEDLKRKWEEEEKAVQASHRDEIETLGQTLKSQRETLEKDLAAAQSKAEAYASDEGSAKEELSLLKAMNTELNQSLEDMKKQNCLLASQLHHFCHTFQSKVSSMAHQVELFRADIDQVKSLASNEDWQILGKVLAQSFVLVEKDQQKSRDMATELEYQLIKEQELLEKLQEVEQRNENYIKAQEKRQEDYENRIQTLTKEQSDLEAASFILRRHTNEQKRLNRQLDYKYQVLKQRYFYSVALSIKLEGRNAGFNNVPLSTLYEEATQSDEPVHNWPKWLTDRLLSNAPQLENRHESSSGKQTSEKSLSSLAHEGSRAHAASESASALFASQGFSSSNSQRSPSFSSPSLKHQSSKSNVFQVMQKDLQLGGRVSRRDWKE